MVIRQNTLTLNPVIPFHALMESCRAELRPMQAMLLEIDEYTEIKVKRGVLFINGAQHVQEQVFLQQHNGGVHLFALEQAEFTVSSEKMNQQYFNLISSSCDFNPLPLVEQALVQIQNNTVPVFYLTTSNWLVLQVLQQFLQHLNVRTLILDETGTLCGRSVVYEGRMLRTSHIHEIFNLEALTVVLDKNEAFRVVKLAAHTLLTNNFNNLTLIIQSRGGNSSSKFRTSLIQCLESFKAAHSHGLNFILNVIADSQYITSYVRNQGFNIFLCQCDIDSTKIKLYTISGEESYEANANIVDDENSIRSRLFHLFQYGRNHNYKPYSLAVSVDRFCVLRGNRLAPEDRLIRDYAALDGYPILVMEEKSEGPVVRTVGICQGINEAAKTVSVFVVSEVSQNFKFVVGQ